MARDILLTWVPNEQAFDIVFRNGDIESDTTLNSMIINQIFTRARLESYEQPDSFLQNSWAGNCLINGDGIGTKFESVITQSPLDNETLNIAKSYINSGLQFLYDNDIVSNINVQLTNDLINQCLKIDIEITELRGQTSRIIMDI